MDDSRLPDLPPDLQARLDAAGVTDAATLQQALDADPELRAAYAAFIEAHQEQFAQAFMAQLLSAFAAVPDSRALAEFWNEVPLELEDTFIALVEAKIAEAEQGIDTDLAEGLRQRLDVVRQLQAEQRETVALISRSLDALATCDDEQLPAIWNGIPLDLEDAFLEAAEQHAADAEEAGDAALAERLRARVAALRQIQVAQRERRNSPTRRALLAFLRAETDDAARLVFAEQRALLQPYEAEELLKQFVRDAPDELRERFTARYELLRMLRGSAPQTDQQTPMPDTAPPTSSTQSGAPSFSNENVTVQRDLNQAGGNITIYNTSNIHLLERRWTRPQPPALTKDVVPREEKVAEVARLLEARGEVTIVGSERTMAVAMQGAAGVGKTTLGKLLARQAQERYPDGVLWEELGSTVRRRDDPLI